MSLAGLTFCNRLVPGFPVMIFLTFVRRGWLGFLLYLCKSLFLESVD